MSQPHRLPAITLGLIAANIAAAFVVVLNPEAMTMLGFVPERPSAVGFLCNVMVHSNLIHLLSNMVFLAAVGPAAEWSLRPWRYALVYFVGGYVGTALHWLLSSGPDASLVLVGASGCIAACVAFCAVRYFTLRVPLAPKISVPLWLIILVWIALQVTGAFIQLGQGSASAYWAHLGGFATGLLFCVVFRVPQQASLVFGHDVLDQMNERGPSAMATAAAQHLKQHPDDIAAWQKLAEAHRMLGHNDDEVIALNKVVEKGSWQVQSLAIQRLSSLNCLAELPVFRRARLADELQFHAPDTSRILLESILSEANQPDAKAEALLSLGVLLSQNDVDQSTRYISMLLAEFPLHDACVRAKTKGLCP